MSAGHREVSLVLTCWCSCSRLCSGTYWMWPVSGCNVYSSGYSDFDNVALFAASLQLLHRFTLFSPKTNSAQFNSVFRVFHYVVIPGTRNFFPYSVGVPSELSQSENVTWRDRVPLIGQSVTSLDESWERQFWNLSMREMAPQSPFKKPYTIASHTDDISRVAVTTPHTLRWSSTVTESNWNSRVE